MNEKSPFFPNSLKALAALKKIYSEKQT